MTWVIWGIYSAGLIICIIVAGTVYDDGNKKLGARIGLMVPVWPVAAIYGLVVLVKLLWEKSGWAGWTEKVRK